MSRRIRVRTLAVRSALAVAAVGLFAAPWTIASAVPVQLDPFIPTTTTSTSPFDETLTTLSDLFGPTNASSTTTTTTITTTTTALAPDSTPTSSPPTSTTTTTPPSASATTTPSAATTARRDAVAPLHRPDSAAAPHTGVLSTAQRAQERAVPSLGGGIVEDAASAAAHTRTQPARGHAGVTGTRARAPFAATAIRLPGGGRSTSAVLTALGGASLPPTTLARLLAPFPVAGEARYSDDFGALRMQPFPHDHEGTDIFAAKGTPVAASSDGVVSSVQRGGAGGLAVRLTAADGTVFYYAHLAGLARGIDAGDAVDKGAILGFVGTSGNAEGSSPHLHFEIHPRGGNAINPAPILDRWLTEALTAARATTSDPSGAAGRVQLTRANGEAALAAMQAASDARKLDGVNTSAVKRPVGTGAQILEAVLALVAVAWLARRTRRRVTR